MKDKVRAVMDGLYVGNRAPNYVSIKHDRHSVFVYVDSLYGNTQKELQWLLDKLKEESGSKSATWKKDCQGGFVYLIK